MPKNIYTPREELICGKIERARAVARILKSVELMDLLADIQHDAERMEAKLISRKDEAALTPCWFLKDYADGWIKFYDVDCAIQESVKTGAVLRYSEDGSYPKDRATLAPAVVEPVSVAVPMVQSYDIEKEPEKFGFVKGWNAALNSAAAPEPEKAQGDDPVGYIDANQLERWRVLRGTEYETAERCYMPWSKEPLKTDISDCCVPVYLKPLTERREPPADLSLDEKPFPWFTHDGDEKGLHEFICNLEWDYFVKGGKDRKGHFLVFLKSGDETVAAIKSVSNKRHVQTLDALRDEEGRLSGVTKSGERE